MGGRPPALRRPTLGRRLWLEPPKATVSAGCRDAGVPSTSARLRSPIPAAVNCCTHCTTSAKWRCRFQKTTAALTRRPLQCPKQPSRQRDWAIALPLSPLSVDRAGRLGSSRFIADAAVRREWRGPHVHQGRAWRAGTAAATRENSHLRELARTKRQLPQLGPLWQTRSGRFGSGNSARFARTRQKTHRSQRSRVGFD